MEAAASISSTCSDEESDCSIGIDGENGERDAGASTESEAQHRGGGSPPQRQDSNEDMLEKSEDSNSGPNHDDESLENLAHEKGNDEEGSDNNVTDTENGTEEESSAEKYSVEDDGTEIGRAHV